MTNFSYVIKFWMLYALPLTVVWQLPLLDRYNQTFANSFVETYSLPFKITTVSVLLLTMIFASVLILLVSAKHNLFLERINSTYVAWRQVLKTLSRGSINFNLNSEQKTSIRLYIVKVIFIPFMVSALLSQIMSAFIHTSAFIIVFDGVLSGSEIYLILMLGIALAYLIDVVCYLVGYCSESYTLGNKVQSVDPFWSGWFVCLVSYYPLNKLLSGVIVFSPRPGAVYESETLTLLILFLGFVCVGIFAYCSLNLGFKASNLTYRGLVTTGAYGIVRHPAYTAKAAAWTLFAIVPVTANPELLSSFVVLIGLYYIRALTEERHLVNAAQKEYEAYCSQVPYRFIPGVL